MVSKERVLDAAKRYLKVKDYVILDYWIHNDEVFIVAKDENVLVFAEVVLVEDTFGLDVLDESKRAEIEDLFVDFLMKNHGHTDLKVRYDVIKMIRLGEDRALLRHHINAFGPCGCLEDE